MICSEFYMHILQHWNLLIDKQKTSEINPLYALANITKQHVTQPDTHSDQYTPDQHDSNINKGVSQSLHKHILHIHDIISTRSYNKVHEKL
jgi:hypothetical protein